MTQDDYVGGEAAAKSSSPLQQQHQQEQAEDGWLNSNFVEAGEDRPTPLVVGGEPVAVAAEHVVLPTTTEDNNLDSYPDEETQSMRQEAEQQAEQESGQQEEDEQEAQE